MEDFFNTVPLVVKQPKNFWGDSSEYYCYNQWGHQVAYIHETTVDAGMQVLRVLAANTAGFQRTVVVNDMWRRPRLLISKDWSIGTAKTTISIPGGHMVGIIDQEFRLGNARFRLLDPHYRFLGWIEGNFWGHDFQVFDAQNHEICRVNRSAADLGEVFTSADTYVIWQRYLELPDPLKTLVVASGIAIDLVMFEGKR